MTFRTIGTFASALTLLVAATAYSPPAQASPVPILIEYDLTITFIPGNPVFTDLTGAVAFTTPVLGIGSDIPQPFFIGGFDSIGTLIPGNPVIPGNPIFTGRFIPGNPVSPVSFSFSGHSGNFNAFAFAADVVVGARSLSSSSGPPIFPLPIFRWRAADHSVGSDRGL